MKTLKTILIASALLTIGSVANAQTTVTNTFETGAAATAASVNANFADLITAIDALGTRVAALEEDTHPETVTLADIVGNKYCVSFFGSIAGNQTTSARIGVFAGTTVLTVVSTTAGTLSAGTDDEFELGWNVSDPDPAVLAATLSVADNSAADSVTINSLTNGLLTITTSDGQEVFNLSPDGNVIVGTSSGGDSAEAEASIVVGMRCL